MTQEVRGRRRGRPALPPGEARDRAITVRLSAAEHADLVARAEAAGEGNQLGRYLYHRAVSRRVPRPIPALNQEAWSRLGRVAGGLTTMAMAAAAQHLETVDRALIEAVRDELRAVRLLLLGADLPPEDGGS